MHVGCVRIFADRNILVLSRGKQEVTDSVVKGISSHIQGRMVFLAEYLLVC